MGSQIAAFATDQGRRGLRETTIVTRRRILQSFASAVPTPERATPAQVEAWLDALPLSMRSRYTYLSAMAAWFDFLRRTGVRRDNPTVDIRRPRLPRLVPRPAIPSDVAHAIGSADERMRAWLCLATYQGFRCVEIGRLRREEVREEADPPLIVVAEGKGGHQAVLPLNGEVELALREYGLRRRGPLFLTRDGIPFRPATISRYIGTFLRSCGVDATAHQLRHLYGTMVYAASRDVFITQQMLRHADPRSSAGYVQWNQQEATSVVRALRVQGTDRQPGLPL